MDDAKKSDEIWTVGRLLGWTTEYFAKKNISSARLDAELLLADLLNSDRIYLYVNFDRPLLAEELAAYRMRVKRRAAHEPLAYILGHREFYKLDFLVSPAVLIPRPETEILVEAAIDYCKQFQAARALDLGTGSGAIAVSMLAHLPQLTMIAADFSAAALEIAASNAQKQTLESRIEFVLSDWFDNISSERFDVIVANPPYIELADKDKLQPELQYEPHTALFSEIDGLECYRRILNRACEYLNADGRLFFEVGYNQAQAVAELAASSNNYGKIDFIQDYSGINRVVAIHAAGK